VILGPPGVGKTHLAVGLGLKAIERGYRVLFTTAAVLIAALTRALAEGRLDDKLKVYTVPPDAGGAGPGLSPEWQWAMEWRSSGARREEPD